MSTRRVRAHSGAVFVVDAAMLPPERDRADDYRSSSAPPPIDAIVPAPPPRPESHRGEWALIVLSILVTALELAGRH